MTKTLVLLTLPFLAAACATALPPREVRRAEFIEPTKGVKRDVAFSRAEAFFAKAFGDANSAIQMRSPAAAQIVAKGNATCNALRQTGDINEYSVHFTLDFQAKDDRVRILFEDLEMKNQKGTLISWAYLQLGDASQVEKIKPCLDTIAKDASRAIAGTKSDASW